jgi:hypothetical protein
LLHDNGVQLVFNGHAHDYERNIATPGGVGSYVTGGGGARASAIGGAGCSTTDAYAVGWSYSLGRGSACGAAPVPASDAQVYHFLEVTVNGTVVTVTPTDSRGATFDVQSYNFAADTKPPSPPGSLTATVTGSGAATVTWAAATDNIGVSAYDIYRGGSYLATVGPGVTSYTDTTAAAGTSYIYQVTARDLAGNTANATVRSPGSGLGMVFFDGFEPGGLSQWGTVSGLTVASALAHSGSFAARATSTGAATYAVTTLPGGFPQLWAQAWVYVASRSAGADLLGLQASRPIVSLYLSPTGKLALHNSVTSTSTVSSTAMPAAGWHQVLLHANINGTASSMDVSPDGTPVPGLTLTGQNLSTSPMTGLQPGKAVAGRTYNIAFDDVSVTQSAP